MKTYRLVDNGGNVLSEVKIDDNREVKLTVIEDTSIKCNQQFICDNLGMRLDGNYAFKSIYLAGGFNWELTRDSQNVLVLIPTRK